MPTCAGPQRRRSRVSATRSCSPRAETGRFAEGGDRAIELLRARPDEIDLVVLDLVMPGMGGEETLRALRGLRPDLRVLLSSGYATAEAAGSAGGGPTGWIRKPYEPEKLAARVKEILGTSPVGAQTADFDAELEALRTEYRSRLPDKVEELATAVQSALSTRNAEDTQRAQRLAHTLKGTAGSYGFDDLARRVERIDETLRQMLERDELEDEADWQNLEDAVAELRGTLA